MGHDHQCRFLFYPWRYVPIGEVVGGVHRVSSVIPEVIINRKTRGVAKAKIKICYAGEMVKIILEKMIGFHSLRNHSLVRYVIESVGLQGLDSQLSFSR